MTSIDLRAFAWPLQPLQGKLAWERDAARLRLAVALGDVQRAGAQLRALQQLDAQAQAFAAQGEGTLDPAAHHHALRYLRSLHLRMDEARRFLQARERTLAVARAACGDSQRRLETLLAMRAAAVRCHVRGALLRQDRLADAAWLAHVQMRRAPAGAAP